MVCQQLWTFAWGSHFTVPGLLAMLPALSLHVKLKPGLSYLGCFWKSKLRLLMIP